MRQLIRILLSLILFGAPVTGYATHAERGLTLVTEEYPPLNYSEAGHKRGIASDLLVEMLAAIGSQLNHKDIAILPWASGYRMALNHPNILLFSMTHTESRHEKFSWVGPILQSEIVLLARKKSQIRIDDLKQIEEQKYKVGIVLDDVGQQLLKEQGVSNRRLYPSNKGIYLAQMLAEERIDLIAYDAIVSNWNLRQLGYPSEEFETVFSLQKADYYYTLSRGTDPQLALKLQNAFEHIKQSGRLQQIIESYLK